MKIKSNVKAGTSGGKDGVYANHNQSRGIRIKAGPINANVSGR
jgi:hypothetical protein